jgi:hypothetical protein
MGFSLYSLGAGPAENTVSNNSSIVVMSGCLAIAQISFSRERFHPAAYLFVYYIAKAVLIVCFGSLPSNGSIRRNINVCIMIYIQTHMLVYIISNWVVVHGLDTYTYKTYNFLLILCPASKKVSVNWDRLSTRCRADQMEVK